MRTVLLALVLLSSVSTVQARTVTILDCALSNSRFCPFIGQDSIEVGERIKEDAIEDASRIAQRRFKINQPYYYDQKLESTCEEINENFIKLGAVGLSERELASCRCVKEAPMGKNLKSKLDEYRGYVDIQANLVYKKWRAFLAYRSSLGTELEQELKQELDKLENEIHNGNNIKRLIKSRSKVTFAFVFERERLISVCE